MLRKLIRTCSHRVSHFSMCQGCWLENGAHSYTDTHTQTSFLKIHWCPTDGDESVLTHAYILHVLSVQIVRLLFFIIIILEVYKNSQRHSVYNVTENIVNLLPLQNACVSFFKLESVALTCVYRSTQQITKRRDGKEHDNKRS